MRDSIAKALKGHGAMAPFLYNLQVAGQTGTINTGNSSRSLASALSSGASVLVIDEGDTAYEDRVKDGIVVERPLGAGQCNVLAGDFNSNVLLGYLVIDGKMVGRGKDPMVSGNAYDVFHNLVIIGNEARWTDGGFRRPAIYCQGVSV